MLLERPSQMGLTFAIDSTLTELLAEEENDQKPLQLGSPYDQG